jgi:lipoyl(octanoyl) transferase
MQPCRITALGSKPIAYETAYEWQRLLQTARRQDKISDTLLLLEHEPVITIGRGSRSREDLLSDAAELQRHGIALVETDRGGEMTYHAPGQLVGYPIIDLALRGRDLHRYLRGIEEVIIATLAGFGVAGERKQGLTGVWVGENKICAIGIKVTHWITMHGFALNVDPDMTPFRRDIVPCGISDKGVVSLAEMGVKTDMITVQAACASAFGNVFDAQMTTLGEPAFRTLLSELEASLVYFKHEDSRKGECRRT